MSETIKPWERVSPEKDTGAWKKGPRITKECMNEGVLPMQRISAAEAMGLVPDKTDANRGKVWFGKHKGKTFEELREADPGYYEWACREVDGFEEKAGE